MEFWPSNRVAQGGLFHPHKVTYSKETHDLIKRRLSNIPSPGIFSCLLSQFCFKFACMPSCNLSFDGGAEADDVPAQQSGISFTSWNTVAVAFIPATETECQ